MLASGGGTGKDILDASGSKANNVLTGRGGKDTITGGLSPIPSEPHARASLGVALIRADRLFGTRQEK